MATVKNFGLAGVGTDVQFGKSGGRFIYDTDHFTVRNAANSDFLETYGKTPVGSSNANALTTKEYVDSVATGLDFKASVHTGTTSNLSATYDNGTAGLGATLTSTSTGVITPTDGDPLHLNDRVLVKDQTDQTQNGIYTVTDLGSGGEYTEINAVDDVSGSLGGTYFTFDDGTTSYYVWYNTGGSTDPAPGGTGIEVSISANDTAETVAQATTTAINAFASPAYLGTAYYDSDETFHLLNDANTNVTDATAGTSGFTVTVQVQGTASPTAWVLTRATDADNSPSNEVSGGMFVFVEHGDTLASTGWVLSEPVGQATLGTDDLVFTQFSGAGAVTVSGTTGEITVVQSGSDFIVSIDDTYVGQTSITTLGTITTGTWQGTTVGIAHGGTGQTSADDIIDAGSGRITVTNGTTSVFNGGLDVSLDVNEGNLNLANMGGSLDLTTQVSGVLPVANGGTGNSTLTTNGVVYGNGTSAAGVTAAGSEGQVLRAGVGGVPSFSTFTIPDTIAADSLLVADTANTLTALTATDAAGDQLLQWNDTTNSFEFVTTSSVGGSKYASITGDTGTANASGVTDTIQMVGGSGITTVAADGAPDSVTFDLDINSLAADTGIDAAVDTLALYDDSAAANVKVTPQEIVDAATINIFTSITGDTGAATVDAETDSLNFAGGEGIVTTVTDVSGVDNVSIALDLNEISLATPIGTDHLVFADGGATNGKVTIDTFISTFLGDVLVDGDFTTNGLMIRTGSGTYTNRSIVASAVAGDEGISVVNGDGVSGDPTVGLDITGLTAGGTNLGATDEIVFYNGTNNRKMTGQELADGVMALANDDRIVSPDGNNTAIMTDGAGLVISTDDGTSAREFFTFNGTTADNRKMIVSNTATEVTFSAGDETGVGGSSTDDVDIRFVPGANGEVIFGSAGTDATLSASDGTAGENFVILGGDGSAGAGGDITLTPGSGTTTDGIVCITDDDSVNVMCFSGVDTAVNYVDLTNAATGGAPTFTVTGTDTNVDLVFLPKGTGVLSVAGTTDYETNVTADDDIPNKKYVDDAISTGTVSGTTSSYKFTVDLTTAGNTDPASSTIPAGATVMRAYINIGTASDAATTLTIGTTAGGAEYADASTNDPQSAGLYVVDLFSTTVGDLRAVVATPGTVGSAEVIVEYKNA